MRTGQVVADRFLLVRLAGQGGMGLVFEAEDRLTSQRVALKLLVRWHDAAFAQRFQREASLLAGLHHPAVVRYVAHGVADDGRPYLAMEWLDGHALSTRLAHERLGVGQCVDLGIAVAEGLAAAHGHGIVHRDLKPSNVFLLDDHEHPVRIIDFGVARVPLAHLTATGVIVGTPGYMSPEQARGDRVGPATDIFALGALLFECLTGERALVGQDLMARDAVIEAPRACELRPSVPEALDELVARMLTGDPRRRPGDAAAIARELLEIRERLGGAEGPLSMRPPALAERERRIMAVVRAHGLPTTATETLGELARAYGATVESLTGGSWLVTLPTDGVASDRAALAARCGLAMRSLATDARMAVSVGPTPTHAPATRGEAFERAGQLLAAAQPGQIRLDATTAGLLLKRFRTKTAFKTRTDDVTLLLAERPWTLEPREVLGRRSPCVGRERQLALLEQTFVESVTARRAATVVVTAPAGVGKSRLAYEAVQRASAREPGLQIWRGRGDPIRSHLPFPLVAQLATGLPQPDAPHGPSADRWLETWQALVRIHASSGPLLVVLEDAQWIDPQSWSAMEAAVRAAEDCPWMLLVVGRAEPSGGDLWREESVTRIDLRPLSLRAAVELTRSLLGSAAETATVERIVAHGAGNPLHIEELVRADKLGVRAPTTVIALLASELESLDADARRLARVASALGRVFRRDALEQVLGRSMSELAIRKALARLCATDVFRKRPPDPDVYTFRCSLVREAAQALVTDEDRTRLKRMTEDLAETLPR